MRSPQPAQAQTKPKATPAEKLAWKDKSLIAGFKRRGFQDVVLMDRNDPTKPFNVKPFKLWLASGRLVRKGEHGVRGLFHITQTDPLPSPKTAPAQPKTEPKIKGKKARATA
jgi:hypothetical protein